jgi:hypothetical protein
MAVEITDKNWKEIIAFNKVLALAMDIKPEIEYCVGNKDGSSVIYSPKQVSESFRHHEQQKEECERWMDDLTARFGINDYATIKRENYPRYDCNAEELMKLLDWLETEMEAMVRYEYNPNLKRCLVVIFSYKKSKRPVIFNHKDRHSAFYHAIYNFVVTPNA